MYISIVTFPENVNNYLKDSIAVANAVVLKLLIEA